MDKVNIKYRRFGCWRDTASEVIHGTATRYCKNSDLLRFMLSVPIRYRIGSCVMPQVFILKYHLTH